MKKENSNRYINLFVDWSFKRVFGKKANKEILLHFLNSFLDDFLKITDVTHLPTENMGAEIEDRSAYFDLLCETAEGEQILIELQNSPQTFFKDRLLYYSTFPIQNQATKGKWDYKLKKVIVFGILNFEMDRKDPRVVRRALLMDSATKDIWNEKLQFITLETPKFNKEWQDCHTNQEKWLWAFCRIHERVNPPENIKNTIFESLTELCDRNRFNGMENQEYDKAMLTYDQYKNFTDYAHSEGYQKGIYQGQKEIALNMLSANFPINQIVQLTGLSENEIQKLLEG